MKISLGTTVHDNISGLEGVVTGRAEYLYGCVQLLIHARGSKDGLPYEGIWIDEARCTPDNSVPKEKGLEIHKKISTKGTGGPVYNSPPTGQTRERNSTE